MVFCLPGSGTAYTRSPGRTLPPCAPGWICVRIPCCRSHEIWFFWELAIILTIVVAIMFQVTKEVIEYKGVNKAIDQIIKWVWRTWSSCSCLLFFWLLLLLLFPLLLLLVFCIASFLLSYPPQVFKQFLLLFLFLRQISGRVVAFDDPSEGSSVDSFLSSSARRTDAHLTFLGQKSKNLTAYVHKLEAFLEERRISLNFKHFICFVNELF